MTYLPTLETAWRKNRKNTEKVRSRPKSLRGRDFFTELAQLYSATKDPRFLNAIHALFNHSIIDAKLNFTRWQTPKDAKHDAAIRVFFMQKISEFVSSGDSVHRACAIMAAVIGHDASSFAAAIKDLENLYRPFAREEARRAAGDTPSFDIRLIQRFVDPE
jgi:hypothetical protein